MLTNNYLFKILELMLQQKQSKVDKNTRLNTLNNKFVEVWDWFESSSQNWIAGGWDYDAREERLFEMNPRMITCQIHFRDQ